MWHGFVLADPVTKITVTESQYNKSASEEYCMIHIVSTKASHIEMQDMLQTLGSYIKLAVDVNHEVLAGRGAMHADCESVLLDNGSAQDDIWGADWYPASGEVAFESLINLRPDLGNRTLEVQGIALRAQIECIIRTLLEGVEHE